MGVKDFWLLASPCEERISLHELRGQIVAVDLAGWVVQNQTAPGVAYKVTRPHLRNLFFRTSTLLSLDILPVFVLDGAPPALKANTIAARNQAVWGHRPSQGKPLAVSNDSPKRQRRKQFKHVLEDCRRLLLSLGVPILQAPGEAEAFCAALNADGTVDGVISDDSDCLCYGAKTVYRHFSTDPKNFSVSRYQAKRLRKESGLSRERIVGMALLLGCDYNPGGVCGVGRDAIVKMFNHWGEPARGELDRILYWRDNPEDDEVLMSKPVHCGTCGHPGSVGHHRKNGCLICGGDCRIGIPCPCEYHSEDNQAKLVELGIKKKALSSPGWPHREVVDEFYGQLSNLPVNMEWLQPSPASFIKVARGKLEWEIEYALEKLVPLVTRWQVRFPTLDRLSIKPVTVIKKRIQGGENMLEIEWSSDGDNSLPISFVSCVPLDGFQSAYPSLLEEFEEKRNKRKGGKKKPAKASSDKENGPKIGAKKSTAPVRNQPSINKFFTATNKDNRVEESVMRPLPPPKKCVLKKLVPVGSKAKRDAVVDDIERILDNISIGEPRSSNENKNEIAEPVKLSDVFNLTDSPRGFNSPPYQAKNFDQQSSRNVQIDDSKVDSSYNDTDLRKDMEDTYDTELSMLVDDLLDSKYSSGGKTRMDQVEKHKPQTLLTSTPQNDGAKDCKEKPSAVELSPPVDFGDNMSDIQSPSLLDSSPVLRSSQSASSHVAQGGKTTTAAPQADKSESSLDEFDLAELSDTPFIERVKRRLNKC